MTHRERFRATVAHEAHGEFLFAASFIPALDRRVHEELGLADDVDLQGHFGLFNPRWVDLKPPTYSPTPDFSAYYEGLDQHPGSWLDELGVLEVPGSEHHFTRKVSPLRNATRFEEIETFPYPDISAYTTDHMAAEVAETRAAGNVAATPVGHIFEDSWQIRGMEAFLMDMVAQPDWCEYILDRITERNYLRAVAGAKAGVDLLLTADDVASQHSMMFSVDTWRQFIKPHWARIYAAAREIKPDIEICYHSDGDVTPIVSELIEIGVTILNPIQPECLDPVKVKKEYGDRIVLDGTIGTQTTMPFGTPDEVRSVVRRRIDTLGYDGALILSPTHVLEPEVPVENIVAFVEAVQTSASL